MSNQNQNPKSLMVSFAEKYGVAPGQLFNTLKNTAFKPKGRNLLPATDDQMLALILVANQYGLNPFTREIFAFPGPHGEITPVVSIDGWARIINEHPAFDGIEFAYSEQFVTMPGGKPCSEWVEAIIYRSDRKHPTRVREYLDEAYQPARPSKNGFFDGPWQSHTKRMLRHKALIQGARVAFGFAGVYDADEAERIRDMGDAQIVRPDSDNASQQSQRNTEADEVIIYPEISQERKAELTPKLDEIVRRASHSAQWAAAKDYLARSYAKGDLQYALEVLSEAEHAVVETQAAKEKSAPADTPEAEAPHAEHANEAYEFAAFDTVN